MLFMMSDGSDTTSVLLQRVGVCCSACCRSLQCATTVIPLASCCSVLQCAAVCVGVRWSVLECDVVCFNVMQCVAV